MSQGNIYVPGETYTSVRATPDLVGRGSALNQIGSAILDASESYLVYVTGQGGIGKTRLVREILKRWSVQDSLSVASELIDLYHTRVHSLAGLIGAILEVIEPLADFYKGRLAKAGADRLEALARAEQEGLSMAEVISRRRETTAFFLDVLNQFTEQHRLVLALDTAERLLVERDPAQQALSLTEERPAILDWLLNDFLPNVRNAVVLVSGRPSENLRQALCEVKGKLFLPVDLAGLTEDEAVEYFEAVIQRAEASGDPRDSQVADTVRRWSDEYRRAIFCCLCDEGDPPTVRPILLALAIDYQIVAGRPLPALTISLDDARVLTSTERAAIRDELGQALVQVLHENRRPADEIIRALGWLRKGADVELLALITELDRKDVEKALNDIRDLSFVKIRPADNRVFLHDEMYSLLERFALERTSDAERERVFKALQKYYDERIEQARGEIAELYRPLAEPALPEPAKVAAARARLQDALVEDLHYRLRRDAAQGFQTYFRYAEEAIVANDASLDMQLRAELLSFLSARDPSGTAEEIDGLRRADVVADAAVRWVKRLTERERYEDAQKIAALLRQEARDLIEAGGDLAKLELDVREAQVLSRLGLFEKVEELLTSAISKLENMPSSPRRAGILARAYNNLGYLHRSLGRHWGAIGAYQKALPLWRGTKIEIEHANTLNNLAFAKAEVGEFDAAWRLASDALKLREEIGPREPVCLGLNTLAHIKIRGGAPEEPEEARRYAERALRLSQRLGSARGQGLALTALAEAERRVSRWERYYPNETASLLREAAKHAEEACKIFRELKSPDRQVEALIEVGCAYRELARFQLEMGEDAQDAALKGQQALEEAAQIAGEQQIRGRQVDALVNLAWLNYYIRRYDLAGSCLDQAQELIPQHYYITPSQKGPTLDKEQVVVPFLVQLGKAELLRGEIAFDQFGEHKDISALKNAGEHYTLSLEYDMLFSSRTARDVRRGMDRIYERLKQLNISEMRAVCNAVADAEKQYGLGISQMRRFLEENFGPWDSLLAAEL